MKFKGGIEAARSRYEIAIKNINKRIESLPDEKQKQLDLIEEQFEQATEEFDVLLEFYEGKIAILDKEKTKEIKTNTDEEKK